MWERICYIHTGLIDKYSYIQHPAVLAREFQDEARHGKAFEGLLGRYFG